MVPRGEERRIAKEERRQLDVKFSTIAANENNAIIVAVVVNMDTAAHRLGQDAARIDCRKRRHVFCDKPDADSTLGFLLAKVRLGTWDVGM